MEDVADQADVGDTGATGPSPVEPPPGEPGGLACVEAIGSSATALLDPITRPVVAHYRSVEKALARNPVTRAMGTVPRTTGFAVRTVQRRFRDDPIPGLPETRLTPGLLASVALDEAVLSLASGPSRYPRRADYERVGAELAEARRLFAAEGWLDDPASYHRRPPDLAPDAVQTRTGWALGQRYERVYFPSGYEPHQGEPGRERWLAFHTNETAGAWVLRHDDDLPRPWLVCIHGFGMGQAFMDFPAFHVAHLHHDLGLNLVGPTLPLHGNRRAGAFSGDHLLSWDLMNSVHGLSQAAWDIRRLLSWIRAQEPTPTKVGVTGVSLGGYTTALLSALDGELDVALAGIPVTDFPTLFELQSPVVIRERSIEHGILGGPAEEVHRVVSPLAMPPLVPFANRAIFAGLGDRLAHPRQAHDLWLHWGEPRIRWYPGNHVGYLWSNRVRAFVDEVLVETGMVGPPA